MSQLHLKIVTPEKEIYSQEIDMVTLPSENGELGILPHHADLMTTLAPGELIIKKGTTTQHLAVGDGLFQIIDNQATILTDLAVNATDIDERAVEEAKKRAEKALEDKLSDEEYADTLASLERSLAQLKVKRRHRAR